MELPHRYEIPTLPWQTSLEHRGQGALVKWFMVDANVGASTFALMELRAGRMWFHVKRAFLQKAGSMFHVERAFFLMEGKSTFHVKRTFWTTIWKKSVSRGTLSTRVGGFAGFLSRNDGFTWNIG
jgi:hypothetical protein